MPELVEGTNTMFFVEKKAVTADRWRYMTYGKIVVDYRPENTDPCRTRLKVGGVGSIIREIAVQLQWI